jgi:hypothetical protein
LRVQNERHTDVAERFDGGIWDVSSTSTMNLLLIGGRLDMRSTLEMGLIAANAKCTFNKTISDIRPLMIAGISTQRQVLFLQVYCTFYTLTTFKISVFSSRRLNRGCPSTIVHSREFGESPLQYFVELRNGAQRDKASERTFLQTEYIYHQ